MICSRCHEVKDRGNIEGVNFICSDCTVQEQVIRANMNRREVLPDGRIRYPEGHIIVPVEEES
jgi:hypothetical protein